MTDTSAEIPPAVRMQQLLTGSEVSQALYVIAELGVTTALLDGPRSVRSWHWLAAPSSMRWDGSSVSWLPWACSRRTGRPWSRTSAGRSPTAPRNSVRGLARDWMKTHYAPFGELLHTARTGEIAAVKYAASRTSSTAAARRSTPRKSSS